MREVRDILAEALRRERYGLMRPLWADMQRFADDECEQVRRRADHIIRLLERDGVRFVQTEVPERPLLTSPVIYDYPMVARQARRQIRSNGEVWEVVIIIDGAEKVEQSFTLAAAHVNAGLVLTGDPSAKSIPGLGSQLAAAAEIHRVHA